MQYATPLQTLTADLQEGRGALSAALRQLERLSLCGRNGAQTMDGATLIAAFLALVPTRAAMLDLISAHGRTQWPAFFGQSPYGGTMEVLRAIAAGNRLRGYQSWGQQLIYEQLFPLLAAPGALARYAMDGGVARRYPHLLHAMRQAAILTTGEAESALRILVRTHPADRVTSPAGSEAVAYFGGNLRVVTQARRWWRSQQQLRALAQLQPA